MYYNFYNKSSKNIDINVAIKRNGATFDFRKNPLTCQNKITSQASYLCRFENCWIKHLSFNCLINFSKNKIKIETSNKITAYWNSTQHRIVVRNSRNKHVSKRAHNRSHGIDRMPWTNGPGKKFQSNLFYFYLFKKLYFTNSKHMYLKYNKTG